jgi:hypothetical protein
VDRHLIDLLLGHGEVGGLIRSLHVDPCSWHCSADEAELVAILCDGEMAVELGHLGLGEGIDGEALFIVVGLDQGGWRRRWLLQGLEGEDGSADVSTELG